MRIARLTVLLGILAAVAAGSLAGASTGCRHGPDRPARLPPHRERAVDDDVPPHAVVRVEADERGAALRVAALDERRRSGSNGILYDVSNLADPCRRARPSRFRGSPARRTRSTRASAPSSRTRHVSPWSADYGFDVVPPARAHADGELPGSAPLDARRGSRRVRGLDLGVAGRLHDRERSRREHERPRRARVLRLPQFAGLDRHRALARARDADGRARAEQRSAVATYGPWSPIYTSTNPAPTTGPISSRGTVSDTVSNGSLASPAHALMPAFVWSGNEAARRHAGAVLPRLRLHRQRLHQSRLDECDGRLAGLRAAAVSARDAGGE